jgi:hypothetical protein
VFLRFPGQLYSPPPADFDVVLLPSQGPVWDTGSGGSNPGQYRIAAKSGYGHELWSFIPSSCFKRFKTDLVNILGRQHLF